MKKIIYILLLLVSLVACMKPLQDLNTNPEQLGSTDPRYIFTGATLNWNNAARHDLTNKYSGVMQLMQYVVASGGAPDGIYFDNAKATGTSPYTPYYDKFFGGQIGLKLRYLVNTVIKYHAEKDKFSDLAAIAKMLEAYEAWLMFDVYGAAPYTEAFKVDEGIKLPKYDFYQDLYKQFDATVKQSVADLSSTTKVEQYPLGNNDFFYQGNINKWIKFGNSLRIKMAQRLEKADAVHYNSVIDEVLTDGRIISNNDESCVYYHPNDHNDNTSDMDALTYNYAASRAFVSMLRDNNDPRLVILVRPNGFGKKGDAIGTNSKIYNDRMDTVLKYVPTALSNPIQSNWLKRYVGMSANPDSASHEITNRPYYTYSSIGYSASSSVSIRVSSQIESRFYVKNGGNAGTGVTVNDLEDNTYRLSSEKIKLFSPQLTYPELCFMMAEIAIKAGSAKGGKSAEDWYKEGITSSMLLYQSWAERTGVPSAMNAASDNYHPIEQVDIDAYLAQPDIFPVTLEKIISQAWVDFYMHPEEAWATWKRTGLPSFKTSLVAGSDIISENGVAYFEEIKKSGSTLIIPRRGVVPSPNDANSENYNKAIEKLTADPNYGTVSGYTKGRIWWDKP